MDSPITRTFHSHSGACHNFVAQTYGNAVKAFRMRYIISCVKGVE